MTQATYVHGRASMLNDGAGLTKATNAANHIFQLRKSVRSEMDEEHDADSEKPRQNGPELSCDRLEFAYPQRPSTRVLKGISLNVRTKPLVLIVFRAASR